MAQSLSLRFKSWFFYFVAVWPWVSYLTSLDLAFLIHNSGLATVPASASCCEDKRVSASSYPVTARRECFVKALTLGAQRGTGRALPAPSSLLEGCESIRGGPGLSGAGQPGHSGV